MLIWSFYVTKRRNVYHIPRYKLPECDGLAANLLIYHFTEVLLSGLIYSRLRSKTVMYRLLLPFMLYHARTQLISSKKHPPPVILLAC